MSAEPSRSSGIRRWDEPGWQQAAAAWIDSTLTERGIAVRGPVERVRSRFWSVHLTVPTDAGRFWFKENCPLQAFEARLVDRLQQIAGDLVVEVTAIEAAQGWLLTPDQGETARDAGLADDVGTYERLLAEYGALQRRIMSTDVDLGAVGVTTMDPARAADYLLTHVARLRELPAEDVGRMDDRTAARLRSLVPDLRGWVDTVAATGLPLTLDHSDLHLGNAFVDPVSGRLRVFDFSDSVVSFPMGTLLVPLRVMRRGDDGGPGPDAVDRVVDAYLENFTDLAPARELRAAVPAALELAKLNRHESWRRALDGADAASYAELGDSPAGWLGLLGDGSD